MEIKKLRLICLALLAVLTIWGVYADETRYITDELHTYTRIGPGDRYKLAGTLNAGEPVTLLAVDQEAKYAKIRDSKGKESWIVLSQLSDQPSLHSRVPALEQKVRELTTQLDNINERWNTKTAELQHKVANSDNIINALREENKTLKEQLLTTQKKINAINVQLDDKKRNIIQQWFMYGGGVAGTGLLLGLLLPHLISRKKSRRWMN